jgi:hypothetical protein
METHKQFPNYYIQKQFKAYFFQFLMIFLAVILGFIAENIREEYIETKKSIEFMISYKDDLIKDTLIIDQLISNLTSKTNACDSLTNYLDSYLAKKEDNIQRIYQYNLLAMGGYNYHLTDRTVSQLKNTGGMHLLKNKKTVNRIMDYWENNSHLEDIYKDLLEKKMNIREKTYLIFDHKYYSNPLDSTGKMIVYSNARFMTNNSLQLTELSNRINHYKNTIRIPFFKFLRKQKRLAIMLIDLIEKEYE